MSSVTLRHFTEADIPLRSGLLLESRFQANLTDAAAITGDDALDANQRHCIAKEHHTKQIYTLCGPREQVVGFAWITSIDWRAQVCEISYGILPRYRGLYGAAAITAAHTYIRLELNMQVTINQVLEHNTMMHSAEGLAAQRQVRTRYDSYTVGEWRAASYWSETEEDVRAHLRQAEERRRRIADRIRTMTRPAS
ncbi:GNAT family N-acetyltransferase [Streptomyces sp. TBY4]|uniref:GNAT family N-acetyltransferase n=1 Tax=Streptomyces sp. TBY4 TaxID=2962030 RepID=UPI0020B711F2|nr:GNAT family N-acetyltransferase [Streptomyces sp. TBY4]MCP3760527.1 GNAT family N-acetyltransferase [Streptomyces sp. TBY4]